MPSRKRTLAQNIEDLRVGKGLSRVALSKKAGLGDSAVNDIVSHPGRDVRLGTIEKLAKALTVSVFDLIPSDGATVDGDNFKPITVDDLSEMLTATTDFVSLAMNSEASDYEFYEITSDILSSWGYGYGDIIFVDKSVPLTSGDVVAIEVDTPQHGPRLIASYYADPVFFGYNSARTPTHRYAAGPDVRVLGKIVAAIKLISTD